MKASCSVSCSRSRSENSAVARRVMRLLPAVAFEARFGSSTTLTSSCVEHRRRCARAASRRIPRPECRTAPAASRRWSTSSSVIASISCALSALVTSWLRIADVGTAVQQRRAAGEFRRADAGQHARGDVVAPRRLVQPVADRMAAIEACASARAASPSHRRAPAAASAAPAVPADPARQPARKRSSSVQRPVDRLEHLDPPADLRQRAIALEQAREGLVVRWANNVRRCTHGAILRTPSCPQTRGRNGTMKPRLSRRR